MGYDVSAYVEKKVGDKWELVSDRPASSRLKYIIEDYRDYAEVKWDDLSDGMREKFKKDADGNLYYNFHAATLNDIEDKVSDKIKELFIRLNTIVKALGCQKMYSDEGDELEPWDDESKEKLTFPVNKSLIEELQYGYDEMRKIGQKEAFDLFVSELMDDYKADYRIVFVVT